MYGPTRLGNPKLSAIRPEGSIRLGPVTAPIVEPQTTSDNCFARLSSVARSIAAKRAWYPDADAAPTRKLPINIRTMFSVEPPMIAKSEPISPVINPAESASLRPPRLVSRAKGSAIAAAPRTENVWARPASVSDSVIDATRSEPAATVPATPTPFSTCAAIRVLTMRDW